MTSDDSTTPPKPVGPDGQPLLGLHEKHGRVPADQRKARPKREMPATMIYRASKNMVDPLDKAAQDALGKKAEDVRLDAPVAAAAVESQVMWLVVARVDGGPWTHQLVAENVRAASFASRRRAEGVVEWLRRTAQTERTGAEAATFYSLECVRGALGGPATFFIDGNLVATHNTNVPEAGTDWMNLGARSCVITTGTARAVDVDEIYVELAINVAGTS